MAVHFVSCCSLTLSCISCGPAGNVGCLYVRRNVRAREVLSHPGDVVVLGNVERGASVLADGDVVVLGHLLGKCHAGKEGNQKSIVLAMKMQPSEIEIGKDAKLLPPAGWSYFYPQVARLTENGTISIAKLYNSTSSVGIDALELGTLFRLASKPAKAALFTGAYIFLAGLAFLIFPKALFGILFSLENAVTGWIQAGAVLGMVFGIYYTGTALGDVLGMNAAFCFYFSTVIGRMFLFCSFCWLVASSAAPAPLLAIALINLVGALLMLRSLIQP